MKNNIIAGAALSFAAVATLASGAYAEGIITDDALKECMEHTTQGKVICSVGDDITLEYPITVTHEVELNLNGHTLKVDEGFKGAAKNSMITVNHGATLSIFGEGVITTGETEVFSPIRLTSVDDTDDTQKAIVNVGNATLEGFYYGIVGSGNEHRGNTEVNLYGATIKGLNAGDCFGIYQPQLGTLNVYDGTLISGDGGIVMKSGDLNIYGGKIIAEGALKETVPYNNGANSTGAALQIESNDGYSDKMHIRITSGELISKNGYTIDEYKESEGTLASVKSFVIEGGTFEGGAGIIRHQSDLGKFIKGGSFDLSSIEFVDTFISSYAVANRAYTLDEGYLIIHAKVQPEEGSLPEGYTTDIEHTDYSQASDDTQALMRAFLGTKITLPEGFKFAQEEDISIYNGSGAEVTAFSDAIRFDVVLENLPAVAEGYTRKWYVIRSHVSGEEEKTEFIDCEYDETSNTLSFGSKYFSAFYIGYVDIETPAEEPEDPEEEPELPKAPDAGIVSPFYSPIPVREIL